MRVNHRRSRSIHCGTANEDVNVTEKIEITDVKLKYATIQEAKQMSGLRIVLGAVAVPGPWREACKGIFYVKKIPYTPVGSAGEDGTQGELIEWTAQASAPVAIWNDERPAQFDLDRTTLPS